MKNMTLLFLCAADRVTQEPYLVDPLDVVCEELDLSPKLLPDAYEMFEEVVRAGVEVEVDPISFTEVREPGKLNSWSLVALEVVSILEAE